MPLLFFLICLSPWVPIYKYHILFFTSNINNLKDEGSFLRVFWLNIAIFNLNQYYRYYLNLIGKLRREKEFRQQCCRNSTKMRREKRKKGERESSSSAQNAARSVKKKAIAATPLPKKEKKNLFWQKKLLWQL